MGMDFLQARTLLFMFGLYLKIYSLNISPSQSNGENKLKFLNKTSELLTHTYSEKVISSGFEFEEHKVLTKDKYILTAWRIPRKIGENFGNIRQPVVLQHGLLDDSWTWFALKAEDCLPIILAKEGYDVWITNSRGNIFSKEHLDKEYDSSSFSSKYWNFTFHEMAKYDLPAFTEYIKNHTLHDKLKYIGHSQGTFQFFLSFLLDPDFIQRNFEKYVTLGTVVTIFNIDSHFVKYLSKLHILDLIERFHFDNFLEIGTSFSTFIHFFCTKYTFVCKFLINSIIEIKVTNRMNYKEIADIYYYEPGGTSTKNLIHWIQTYQKKELSLFDYGKLNMEYYGQPEPPKYDVKNFKNWKLKSLVTISDSDPLSSYKDLQFFLDAIDNKTDLIQVKNLTNYNHLDYLWSRDAKDDIYLDIIKFLNDS